MMRSRIAAFCRSGLARLRCARRAAPALLLAATGACGDPLTDGDWLGTPEMVVRGGTVPLPPELEAELELALVWTVLGDATVSRYAVVPGEVASDRDFGAFELALYAGPPEAVRPAPEAVAVALVTVLAVPDSGAPDDLDVATLGELVRAVSDEHYVVWTADADRARAAGTPALLNPVALEDGYNLAVGVCRDGRPSQLMIVAPERVSIIAAADARPGACLDVFWGAWREP